MEFIGNLNGCDVYKSDGRYIVHGASDDGEPIIKDTLEDAMNLSMRNGAYEWDDYGGPEALS